MLLDWRPAAVITAHRRTGLMADDEVRPDIADFHAQYRAVDAARLDDPRPGEVLELVIRLRRDSLAAGLRCAERRRILLEQLVGPELVAYALEVLRRLRAAVGECRDELRMPERQRPDRDHAEYPAAVMRRD